MRDRLEAHVRYLADDRLQGRETGTPGEREALDYIEKQFAEIGLAPAGDSGFEQSFSFTAGKNPSANSLLVINGQELEPDTDYYALAEGGEGDGEAATVFGGFGVNSSEHGSYLPAGSASGRVLLLDLSVPGGYHPHSSYADYADVRTKINSALQSQASALVLFTRDPHVEAPDKHWGRKITESEIPVFWLTETGYRRLYGDRNPVEGNCRFALHWDRDHRTGHNALALLDNPDTDRLVVIGAHYDHLGHGIAGSLHPDNPAIHNGADDNASGVAGLIELARLLKANGPFGSDYLFIAFSGEELGLYGSRNFVDSKHFDSTRTAYMINYDMIGRLDSIQKTLIVDGANSSPEFAVLEQLSFDSLKIKAGGSGVGSSDHMSFYLEGIPALHFFTGTHSDYHRPGDDADKINFGGMVSVLNATTQLIEALDGKGKLTYLKTAEESLPAPDFKVTLGVIPDYMFEGRGMRIENIREGRPAALAGLQDGDIVLRLGDVDVLDMTSYMVALSRFNKGEQTTVQFQRGTDTLRSPITF